MVFEMIKQSFNIYQNSLSYIGMGLMVMALCIITLDRAIITALIAEVGFKHQLKNLINPKVIAGFKNDFLEQPGHNFYTAKRS